MTTSPRTNAQASSKPLHGHQMPAHLLREVTTGTKRDKGERDSPACRGACRGSQLKNRAWLPQSQGEILKLKDPPFPGAERPGPEDSTSVQTHCPFPVPHDCRTGQGNVGPRDTKVAAKSWKIRCFQRRPWGGVLAQLSQSTQASSRSSSVNVSLEVQASGGQSCSQLLREDQTASRLLQVLP